MNEELFQELKKEFNDTDSSKVFLSENKNGEEVLVRLFKTADGLIQHSTPFVLHS